MVPAFYRNGSLNPHIVQWPTGAIGAAMRRGTPPTSKAALFLIFLCWRSGVRGPTNGTASHQRGKERIVQLLGAVARCTPTSRGDAKHGQWRNCCWRQAFDAQIRPADRRKHGRAHGREDGQACSLRACSRACRSPEKRLAQACWRNVPAVQRQRYLFGATGIRPSRRLLRPEGAAFKIGPPAPGSRQRAASQGQVRAQVRQARAQ